MTKKPTKKLAKRKAYRIAVVGATGLVGGTALTILEERGFPIEALYLLASSRSTGEVLDYAGKSYEVQDLHHFDFSQVQLCFFCTDNEIASKYVPLAVDAGAIVIDKSSFYRYDAEVPLIVPEVNEKAIKDFRKKGIIANPNCTTIPITVALKAIYDAVGIARINIATYQSVSGAGKDGVKELADQTVHLLNGLPIKPVVFAQQIAFNVIPHIDGFQENGYTREEMKMVWEIQKIFDDERLTINPTAVRVPVFYGHAAALHIETRKKLSVEQAKKLMNQTPGLCLIEGQYPYPTPAKEGAGDDVVYVGRVREDISSPQGLDLWVVADNLRKGAALNAVQIAEKLIEGYL